VVIGAAGDVVGVAGGGGGADQGGGGRGEAGGRGAVDVVLLDADIVRRGRPGEGDGADCTVGGQVGRRGPGHRVLIGRRLVDVGRDGWDGGGVDEDQHVVTGRRRVGVGRRLDRQPAGGLRERQRDVALVRVEGVRVRAVPDQGHRGDAGAVGGADEEALAVL